MGSPFRPSVKPSLNHFVLGRLPDLHLLQVGLVDAHDHVQGQILAGDRQSVLRQHTFRLLRRDVDLDAKRVALHLCAGQAGRLQNRRPALSLPDQLPVCIGMVMPSFLSCSRISLNRK
jgi:hypothetical protein